MEKRVSLRSLILACVICLAVGAAIVIAAVYFYVGGNEGLALVQKVNAVRHVIDNKYVGNTQWGDEADAAASAMIDALGDRWSYYMTAEEYEDYEKRLANTTQGIGVTITVHEETGGFEILAVTPGSPADNAGIKTSDIIISVAGNDMRGHTVDELKAAIQSHDGDFTMGLMDKNGAERSVTVSRQVIYTSPVSFEMKENNIGYVRIANFHKGCSDDAKAAVQELMEQGAKSLIFDVRANGGGLLGQLIPLLDYLLPEGDIFVSVSKDGEEYVYTSDSDCIELPMVVLFDRNTYSAAEFFAAALSEYGAAATIGEHSTGKGRSQETFVLYDGSAVHISSNRYLTPNRVDLSEQGGLEPDFSVDPDPLTDTQLAAAIEYLS